MGPNVKSFLIKTWAIGAVVFIVASMLHLQHFVIGLILGIFNTFIIYPICDAIIMGNKSGKMTHKKILINTLNNVLIAVTISMIIRFIDYYILRELIKDFPIEPFRFMAMYQLIYYGAYYSYKKIFNKGNDLDES